MITLPKLSFLLCVVALIYAHQVIAQTAFVEVFYDDFEPICGAPQCDRGLAMLPCFSCSSNPRWNNGSRFFQDPLPASSKNLAKIVVHLIGIYGCGDLPDQKPSKHQFESAKEAQLPDRCGMASITKEYYKGFSKDSLTLANNTFVDVYLAGTHLASIGVEEATPNQCKCKNCVTIAGSTVKTPNGWPTYKYRGYNTIQVTAGKTPICMSALALFFYNEGDL